MQASPESPQIRSRSGKCPRPPLPQRTLASTAPSLYPRRYRYQAGLQQEETAASLEARGIASESTIQDMASSLHR